MPYFRCYFLNAAGRIIGVAEMEHPTAEDAITASDALCRERKDGRCVDYEVWMGSKLVRASSSR